MVGRSTPELLGPVHGAGERAGLRYAFLSASGRALRRRARLSALHDAVFDRPRIARYVASGRRLDFNNDDLFRHYPELDR